MDITKVQTELELLNAGRVSVEPSAIVGSPYDYVYLYLSPKEHEGLHIIVSDAAEHGEVGAFVGKYPHFEAEGECMRVPDDEVLETVRGMV